METRGQNQKAGEDIPVEESVIVVKQDVQMHICLY